MALLDRFLSPTRIITLRSRSKEGAIRELVGMLSLADRRMDPDTVTRAIQDRERIVSSWIAPSLERLRRVMIRVGDRKRSNSAMTCSL